MTAVWFALVPQTSSREDFVEAKFTVLHKPFDRNYGSTMLMSFPGRSIKTKQKAIAKRCRDDQRNFTQSKNIVTLCDKESARVIHSTCVADVRVKLLYLSDLPEPSRVFRYEPAQKAGGGKREAHRKVRCPVLLTDVADRLRLAD